MTHNLRRGSAAALAVARSCCSRCRAAAHLSYSPVQCLIEKGGYTYLDVRPTLELDEVGAAGSNGWRF